ncbi:hypothetical protein D3C80_2078790 [compost metagenome]
MNLHLMHQQLARTRRIIRIRTVTLLKRADMHVVDMNLTVTDGSERITNVSAAITQRLDLCTG